jgi:cation/acetate symporter
LSPSGHHCRLLHRHHLLITGAGAFSYDIYYRLINPRASERQRMRMAKGDLVLALLVVVVAVKPPGMIAEITAVAFALAGNTLFPVFLLGLWWDRPTSMAPLPAC